MISIVALGQKKECDQFREGYFKIEDSITGVSLLHRVGNKQKEYNSISKMKLELSLEWSECGYKLILDKVVDNPYDIEMDASFTIDVAILETNENSYVQKSTSPFSDMVIQTNVQRITEKEYREIFAQQKKIDKGLSIDDPAFKKEVADSMCNCFSEVDKTKIDQNFFANCIAKGLLNHQEQLISIALQDTTGTDPEILGRRLGEELVLTVQKDLIHDCDDYFYFLDEIKKEGENKRFARADQKITDSLSFLIENRQELSLYRSRAENYLGLKDFENAEKDIDICFVFDPKDVQSKLLYALVLEGKEEYTKAADLYIEISEITGNKFLPIIAELVKRKAKK
ncbi:hypothetical protein SAMN04487910_0401 [Aquimarina amphilecti]|uniref:Tetratricopeptide repeat-containing protein n=1 Tax=Aquimarina amphilecti TaxID=1038014 RepID=A0A1H7GPH8_AQUAM|nr:hypothetical protein [Aquimarina amphilecti]SEK38490.1 hypothetical protein SAMN04487910_0401 [Aquimarina amphilecti]